MVSSSVDDWKVAGLRRLFFGLVCGIVHVQERCWRVPKMEVVSDSRLGGSSGQFFTENVAA